MLGGEKVLASGLSGQALERIDSSFDNQETENCCNTVRGWHDGEAAVILPTTAEPDLVQALEARAVCRVVILPLANHCSEYGEELLALESRVLIDDPQEVEGALITDVVVQQVGHVGN
jgi:hypothetical protein